MSASLVYLLLKKRLSLVERNLICVRRCTDNVEATVGIAYVAHTDTAEVIHLDFVAHLSQFGTRHRTINRQFHALDTRHNLA